LLSIQEIIPALQIDAKKYDLSYELKAIAKTQGSFSLTIIKKFSLG